MQYIVFALIAIAMAASSQLYDVMQQGQTGAQVAQRTQASALLTQAANVIATESSDVDGDGFPESAAFLTATPAPTSGGQIATASGAPKLDAWGTAFGYCSWDNGSINSSTNRITGDNPSLQSSVVFAVISAGPDKTFNTTCAQAKAGTAQGDDGIRTLTVAQLAQGVGGTQFWGDPVANPAALAALTTTGLKAGSTRLVVSTNSYSTWSGSAWVTATNGSGSGLQAPSYTAGANPSLANVSGNPIVAVSQGWTAIIDTSGYVYVAGLENATYQEWGEPLAQRLTWTKLSTISGATGVWFGGDPRTAYPSMWVLKADKTLWVSGYNATYGGFGTGAATSLTVFTQVRTNVATVKTVGGLTYVLDADGKLSRAGNFSGYDSYAYSTAAGPSTSMTWVTEKVSGVTAVAFASNCAMRVDSDAQMWMAGGISTSDATFCSPTASNGTTATWQVALPGVASVQAGCYQPNACSQYIIKTDGTLWAKGSNANGQLGLGDIASRTAFAQVSSLGTTATLMLAPTTTYSACAYAVDSAGALWSTGTNTNYNLGFGDTTQRTTFTKVTNPNIVNVVGVYEYGCAKTIVAKSNGSLWVVGTNSNGQYGSGTGTATYTTWTQIL